MKIKPRSVAIAVDFVEEPSALVCSAGVLIAPFDAFLTPLLGARQRRFLGEGVDAGLDIAIDSGLVSPSTEARVFYIALAGIVPAAPVKPVATVSSNSMLFMIATPPVMGRDDDLNIPRGLKNMSEATIYQVSDFCKHLKLLQRDAV